MSLSLIHKYDIIKSTLIGEADKYEKEIEEALEADEFKSVKNLEEEITFAKGIAENQTRKD